VEKKKKKKKMMESFTYIKLAYLASSTPHRNKSLMSASDG
jgi:hypothetical protein